MAYAPGLLGRSGVRRLAYVGPKLTPNDVVYITDNYGRLAFLTDQHIDLKKGKAYDARLHMPTERREGPQPPPPGGTGGRRSFTGVRSIETAKLGLKDRIDLAPNIYNQY